MNETMTANRDHPAKYSESILRQLARFLADEYSLRRPERPLRVLDPFAGIGGVHALASSQIETVGVEIEPEWAECHPDTQVGDATALPAEWTSTFDVIVTSVCYGNRMADGYDGRGICRSCGGTGIDDEFGEPCARCDGKGYDQSKRYTYRISLGRELTDGSAAGMRFGGEYRKLHMQAIVEWERVLIPNPMPEPGSLLLLNVSNFWRGDELVRVTEWFTETLCARGWHLIGIFPVQTRRMRNGANGSKRAEFESIIVARPPVTAMLPFTSGLG